MSNAGAEPGWIADTPWRSRSLVLMAGLSIAGLIGIWVCYGGCRDADRWATQLNWILGAIACAGIAVLGMFSWLLAGLRAVRAEKRYVTRNLMPILPRRGRADGPSAPGELGYWADARMKRYHLSTCLLVRGKHPFSMSLDELAATGRTACGVCLPLERVS
ncbi:hypothetical protein [Sporichthya sp.]|uniref:hypothetical protein n=1 Tax=Sporichthya sp. TaxID=65475 RepID=UPI0018439BDC|nr:hypothetical protein [Sporichthya sp.]MBA3741472.1 hypothetical protein [Sporichthya sp.]